MLNPGVDCFASRSPHKMQQCNVGTPHERIATDVTVSKGVADPLIKDWISRWMFSRMSAI